MTLTGTIVLTAVCAYAAIGAAVAVAFAISGVTRVLSHPVSVTPGARILFVPAAFALWPLVLRRWLIAGKSR